MLKIGKKMGVNVNIPENKSFMKEAPQSVSVDLNRVEKEYGNKKYVDLDSGINQTIEWIKLNR
jgi:nucleoside-diphosphate-sugar epimerase